MKLRKPYQDIAPIADVTRFYKNLNSYLKLVTINWVEKEDKFQYATCWKKAISRGIRLHIFILAKPKGVPNWVGATKVEYDEVCGAVQNIISETFKDIKLHIEPYSETGKCHASLDTYIMYNEMQEA